MNYMSSWAFDLYRFLTTSIDNEERGKLCDICHSSRKSVFTHCPMCLLCTHDDCIQPLVTTKDEYGAP